MWYAHTQTHAHIYTASLGRYISLSLDLGGVVTAIDCPPDQVFSLEEIERVMNSNNRISTCVLCKYQEHVSITSQCSYAPDN